MNAPVILPGSTLGVLGGGQLGRMFAMAAREMGYHIRALDPDPRCAARFSVEELIVARFDDIHATSWLASQSHVVTLEIEQIAGDCLERAAQIVPVRPGPQAMSIIRDRIEQKTFLAKHVPVGPFGVVRNEEDMAAALQTVGPRCFVKIASGGYDGRGQIETDATSDPKAVWEQIGGPCVVEKALPIEAELSVLVARSPSGEVQVYPPALNHHEARILTWSVLPAPIDPKLEQRAREIAQVIASALGIEGLLCVELFLVAGDLLVNELAPRPHNSYHASVLGCVTSQFEQHVRAVCNLPLGQTDMMRPAAIYNLLGDIWEPTAPAFDRALALPGVRVHLYGKAVARPGRKMGHLSATAPTPNEAVERVQQAYALLTNAH